MQKQLECERNVKQEVKFVSDFPNCFMRLPGKKMKQKQGQRKHWENTHFRNKRRWEGSQERND